MMDAPDQFGCCTRYEVEAFHALRPGIGHIRRFETFREAWADYCALLMQDESARIVLRGFQGFGPGREAPGFTMEYKG